MVKTSEASACEVTVLTDYHLSGCPEPLKLIEIDKDARDGAVFNEVVRSLTATHILFLHSSNLPKDDLWVERLLQYSQDSACGMVGGRIIPEDEKHYRVGRLPEMYMTDAKYYAEFLQMCSVHMNGLQWSQEVAFVNSAFCMVKRELWQKCDGFNEQYYTLSYAVMELAFKLSSDGYRNIYSADAIMIEQERVNTRASELYEVDKDLFKHNKLCDDHEMISQYYNDALLRDESMNLDDFYKWYC